ncbi:formyltransferase family protein [Streptomyces sp. HNM0663]|uniref:Formyltransferase family protein n=1 Tax=Streptomyces chengmaiensis TaxID=3040919 RepID=A0ABT6HH53_9ACTN|nr:formyltransferase family protein [Streptomyces chengmaiensis]MDH2387920.1 formyltransferase family protein [Streptomyces chengmaiensis]
MIFVGEGALLWRAVEHTLAAGLTVDLVCGPGREEPRPGVPYRAADDVNSLASVLADASSDGVVWSVNNPMIFRAPVLSSGLRVLNVHHGPLPAYRGRPEVALVYAMLHGEREFAATLHEVDAGLDTGPVLAAQRYPIGPEEPYHLVLRRGLDVCRELFERCLPLVAADPGWAGEPTPPVESVGGGYFGRKALDRLGRHRDAPGFSRATDLGFLAGYLPELAGALRATELQRDAGLT